MGQIALPDDEIKEIFYHAVLNLLRKKKSKHGYKCLDRSIQEEMPGFFESKVEKLEAPAPAGKKHSETKERKKKSKK